MENKAKGYYHYELCGIDFKVRYELDKTKNGHNELFYFIIFIKVGDSEVEFKTNGFAPNGVLTDQQLDDNLENFFIKVIEYLDYQGIGGFEKLMDEQCMERDEALEYQLFLADCHDKFLQLQPSFNQANRHIGTTKMCEELIEELFNKYQSPVSEDEMRLKV